MTKSSRFVVATHCLTLLAYGDGEAMTSDYIAGSVNTNPVVVRRILGMLAKAGLVTTHEGAGGGVRLAKSANDIDLRTVFAAVEPDELFAPHPQDPNAPSVATSSEYSNPPRRRPASFCNSLAGTTVADSCSTGRRKKL